MSVIMPILKRSATGRYPLHYFTNMTRTERNLITTVLECIFNASKMMLTLQAPESWIGKGTRCSKLTEDSLDICRRHLAHYVIKMSENYSDMDDMLQYFLAICTVSR